MIIRKEIAEDISAIHAVNAAAFEREGEADLVDALRRDGLVTLSLVAEIDGEIVGHVLFCPVTVGGVHSVQSLGPVAVVPSHQKQGVGVALIERALEMLRDDGHEGVIVLGHPEYYPRFGFVPASRFGITCPFPAPDEAFMALELKPDGFAGKHGEVAYPAAFMDV